MCSRNVEASMEVEGEIAQITSILTRADDSWSETFWTEFVIEKKLYFGVNLFEGFLDRGRRRNLKWLYLDVLKYPAILVSCSTDKFRSSRIIPGKLSNCFRQMLFQAWVAGKILESRTQVVLDCKLVGILNDFSKDL
jgi:hypothetical protein